MQNFPHHDLPPQTGVRIIVCGTREVFGTIPGRFIYSTESAGQDLGVLRIGEPAVFGSDYRSGG